MKKIKYLVALLTMVVLFCVAGNIKVEATYQEEIEQIKQNESNLSKFFDKELIGHITDFGIVVIATVFGVSSFLKKFKSITGSFTSSADKNEETKKEIVDTKETILSNNKETQKAITENNELTLKAIKEDNIKTREELNMVKEVLLLAFSNDEKLVKKGVAEQIVNKLGSDSNGKTN